MSKRLGWPPVVHGRWRSSRHEVVLGETDRANVEALARSLFPDRELNLSQVVRCALERTAHQLFHRKPKDGPDAQAHR
jgi:hypothetical protein